MMRMERRKAATAMPSPPHLNPRWPNTAPWKALPRYGLTQCGLLTPCGHRNLDQGFVLSGNKLLPEPILTEICVAIWCHKASMSWIIYMLYHIYLLLPSILEHESAKVINSSDAVDGIFRLWESIPCLLMPWLLKSPEHQQVWYCRTDSIHALLFRSQFCLLLSSQIV